MKKIFIFLIAVILFNKSNAQSIEEYHQTANAFMIKGDYTNALMVLTSALLTNPDNMLLNKDMAQYYYLQNDYQRALDKIFPLLTKDSADDQCFQIAGNVYKALSKVAECEALYKNGIAKFPTSGPLYNELGELLWAQQNNEAIRYWEKGIEKDPSYPQNYYNATKYYYRSGEKSWTILYGEIFVNMDPRNVKTPEIKTMILQSYKKLFGEFSENQLSKDSNAFVKKFLMNMYKQRDLSSLGITTSSLIMIRTRFLLDWNHAQTDSIVFQLFTYHQQLLQEGLFEAYNQWLFGAAENLVNFQNWVQNHPAAYDNFVKYHKNHLFKMPSGQYYH